MFYNGVAANTFSFVDNFHWEEMARQGEAGMEGRMMHNKVKANKVHNEPCLLCRNEVDICY